MKIILEQLNDEDVLFNLNSLVVVKKNDDVWYNWQPLFHIDFETDTLKPIVRRDFKSIDDES